MSDQQETIFIEGMWFKKPHENAKDFVKGRLSINLEQFAPFIKEHSKDGWLNIDLLESKNGSYYAKLDTWEPTGKKEEKKEEEAVNPEDLPF